MRFLNPDLEYIHDETGINPLTENLFEGITPRRLKFILYAGLRGNDPNLTIEEVSAAMDVRDMPRIITTCAQAFNVDADASLLPAVNETATKAEKASESPLALEVTSGANSKPSVVSISG